MIWGKHDILQHLDISCLIVSIWIISIHLVYSNRSDKMNIIKNDSNLLVQAKCLRCPWALQRECSVKYFWDSFSFFFLLGHILSFLPEGVVLGFWNFAWGFKSQKNKIWDEQNLPPNLPLRIAWNGLKIYQKLFSTSNLIFL